MGVALACLWLPPAAAIEVGLAGTFPGKALLTIDGGPPRIVPLGTRTDEGVRVVAVASDTVTIEVDGRRQTLRLGQNAAASPAGAGQATAVLTADGAGHFLTTGAVNGKTVRFIVDTGASMVSLGASDARRIGLDLARGQSGVAQTANGLAPVTRVRLDTVRVGDIVVSGVDATVLAQDMPFVLLGMSFLNRMDMQRNGGTMTLKKNY